MTLYVLIIFIHITSALALFIAFGIEWTAIAFLARAATPAEAQTWLRLGKLAPLINGPALGVLILSGGYLASLTGAMKQGWIPASFLGIAVVMLFGAFINTPRMRAIRLALPAGGEKLSAALHTKLLPVSVRLRSFIALGIVFLMAAKLPFGQSMLALAGGAVLGFLFSIPVFASKPS
jgi:hypothetical protein